MASINIARKSCIFYRMSRTRPSRPRPFLVFGRPTSSVERKMAKFIVTPSASFIDETISVCVYGVQEFPNVTIRAFVEEMGRTFEAYAHFIPDVNGAVKVDSHPSIGGSYKGVKPMGLFTHMQPSPGQKAGTRLVKKDVTTPLLFHLTAYKGFLSTDDFNTSNIESLTQSVLGKTTVERWYMGKDVDRIEVRSGNIRGTLFKPKGNGPFPGIIDLFGAAGGNIEFRSSLFATYGFASLSLAYFAYEDLVTDPNEVDMVYFEEAVDWMLNNPFVMDSGIGVIGVSSGGQAVLKLSTICGPKIKACVCISGTPFYTPNEPARLYKGKESTCLNIFLDRVIREDDIVDVSRYWPYKREDIDYATIMNLEDATCQFLFINGLDDKSWSSDLFSKLGCEYLKEHGKDNWKILSYPGAGHLIEPPYAPLCSLCYYKSLGLVIKYGGNPDEHSVAQEDSWEKMLAFFKEHVGASDPVRSVPSIGGIGVITQQSKL
ncbi:acyl-coenzyme A amino acid N-acyltransferase 2-like [Antedon mediterranea]|uniref:acyl-coenzyme A amino acid N-acyltransferase 2-like n=1 Tax=Antedon mediterranea TaxID=105859 RepID=UPI003AF6BAB5